jgi:predicted transcriptional regulator
MTLYEILINKPCIWILKELYDSEVVNKKRYTIKASELKKYLKIEKPDQFIVLLEKNGLLHADDVSGDKVISLNQKGKDFFKAFDKLKVLVESQVKIVEDRPIAKIEYELTKDEKEALFSVYKISQTVTNELNLNIETPKQEAVYDKLQQLNLVAKVKKGKGFTVELTPTGKRVLQQEISEKLKR